MSAHQPRPLAWRVGLGRVLKGLVGIEVRAQRDLRVRTHWRNARKGNQGREKRSCKGDSGMCGPVPSFG